MVEEGIDPALHSRVIVKGVAVEIAEFRDVQLQGRALKGCGDVGFHKSSSFEGNQALKTLVEQHHIPMVNVFAN